MKTLRQQTLPPGEGKSTSSQEGSPANRFQWQESDLERKMTATSGRTCCERYARYSPLGSLARTLLGSSRWYSPARSLKWVVKPLYSMRVTERERNNLTQSKKSAKVLNVRDIQSNRLLFQLVPSARPTGGTGYGLLPTVQTQGLKTCNKNGRTKFVDLAMLPTPTAIDKGGGRVNKSLSENARERPTLAMAAKMGLLPTPTAMDWKTGTPVESKTYNRDTDLKNFVARRAGQTSQLNPLFVTEMMGFPLDWLTLPFQNGEQKALKL